ncbi:hypothetical protein N7450_005032 [Penicillium hetheringtonii]|uniref:Uncharacterized protein n=1 Tax=Penicillium hetheringtonii TaxID=911720 RepID=A0AAD6GWB6_9EURO|nr:hypothetical protein N7450_005032 [Penicillium hetheringtonii]
MPPIRSLKHLDSEHQEGRIQLALNAYNKGEIKSLRAAATAFNLDYMLQYRNRVFPDYSAQQALYHR